MTSATADRIYYMDAMRSILMLLGVFLHSARLYDDQQSWIIANGANSSAFTYLVEIIHSFRMPAFFIVSGFFCLMTLQKYPPSRWLKQRLTRIIVPILTVALVLNTAQTYYVYQLAGGESSWAGFSAYLSSEAYWSTGQWVFHLWFLNYLVLYFLIAFSLFYTLPWLVNKLGRIANQLLSFAQRLMGWKLYFFGLPFLDLSVQAVLRFLNIADYKALGFLAIEDIVHYGFFFALGIYFFAHREELKHFSRPGPLLLASLAAAIAALLWLQFNVADDVSWANAAELFLNTYISLAASAIVFWVFLKLFDQPSKMFSYLSDASYSTYLFHHGMVVYLGALLVSMDFSIFLKYPLVVGATIAISLILHSTLVQRVSVFGFLFNGKTGK